MTRRPPLAPAASSHTSIHTTPLLIVSLLIIESEVAGAYMEGIDKSEGFVLRGDFGLSFAWITDLIWVCFDGNTGFRMSQAGPG
jgi:hypothetical protein